jgi:hypothetical protein
MALLCAPEYKTIALHMHVCVCDWGVYVNTSCHCETLTIYILSSTFEKHIEGRHVLWSTKNSETIA